MFRKLREKIRRQKLIEAEVLETLSSICLYLEDMMIILVATLNSY